VNFGVARAPGRLRLGWRCLRFVVDRFVVPRVAGLVGPPLLTTTVPRPGISNATGGPAEAHGHGGQSSASAAGTASTKHSPVMTASRFIAECGREDSNLHGHTPTAT
jgi:hypothetical protein